MTQATIRAGFVFLFALTSTVSTSAQQQQDFSQVQIKATKLADNFHMLEGQGGQIGVLSGPDGVFMVDSQFAPLSDKIAAAIKQITPAPIKYLVNTHLHGDHTGGNENFAKMGVTLLSRDQLRARMAVPGANGAAVPKERLALITYDGPVTLHMNGEQVQLIPVRGAHTDGDTLVRFVNHDILMPGDYYRSIAYPNIDRNNGGSLNGMLEGLGLTIGMSGPNTRILPGHGPIVNRQALVAHRDMILSVRDKVAQLIKEGKNLAAVQAAKPTSEWDARVAEPGTTGERFVGQLYAELGGK